MTFLHKSLSEADPTSFVLSTLEKTSPEELEKLDKDTGMNVLQHAAYINRLEVVLALIVKKNKSIDQARSIPNADCVLKTDPGYRQLVLAEQTAFMLATKGRTRFSFVSEILLALGADRKKSLELCRDEKIADAMRAVKLDTDIVRALLFWLVLNTQDTLFLDAVIKQIASSPSINSKATVDVKQFDSLHSEAKVDVKQFDSLHSEAKADVKQFDSLEKDFFGFMELAAQRKAEKWVSRLIVINGYKVRQDAVIKSVYTWAADHKLQEIMTVLNNKQIQRMKHESQMQKLSHAQKRFYSVAELSDTTRLHAISAGLKDDDIFSVVNQAYQDRDFVALNCVIEYIIKENKIDLLLKYIVDQNNRGLFFLVAFVSQQEAARLEMIFQGNIDKLAQLCSPEHTVYPSSLLQIQDTVVAKIKCIDAFLDLIEKELKKQNFLKRFGELHWSRKLLLPILVGGIAVSSYYVKTITSEIASLESDLSGISSRGTPCDSIDCDASNLDRFPECEPLHNQLCYEKQSVIGPSIGLGVSGFSLLSAFISSGVWGDAKNIAHYFWRDLGFKTITAITPTLASSSREIITKLQSACAKFELTENSTVDQFKETLPKIKKEFQTLRKTPYSLFVAGCGEKSNDNKDEKAPLIKQGSCTLQIHALEIAEPEKDSELGYSKLDM